MPWYRTSTALIQTSNALIQAIFCPDTGPPMPICPDTVLQPSWKGISYALIQEIYCLGTRSSLPPYRISTLLIPTPGRHVIRHVISTDLSRYRIPWLISARFLSRLIAAIFMRNQTSLQSQNQKNWLPTSIKGVLSWILCTTFENCFIFEVYESAFWFSSRGRV